jgi:hypothetical protein
VIATDDITCSLCHGVNVASVTLPQYHVTQYLYQRFIQKLDAVQREQMKQKMFSGKRTWMALPLDCSMSGG